MTRLLIDNPKGFQEIIEVGEGGGYFDPDRVIYDERVNGPMDVSSVKAQLGAWKMDSSKGLVVDASKKSSHDSALATIKAAQDKVKDDKSNQVGLFKQASSISTIDEAKSVLVAIVKYLKLDS